MALKLGELSAVISADDSPMEQGLARAESRFRAAGREMESDAAATAKTIGENLGDGVVRGADGRLRDASGRLVRTAEDVGGEAGARGAEGFGARFGERMNALALGIGAAAAVALAAGITAGLDLDAARTKLSAQLGGGQYAEDMGRIAGRIYARGFGESAQAVGDALRAVLSSGLLAEDAADAEIEALTTKAISLAQVFDQDVTATARAAGQMIRNGLARDGAEAMDILARGFQETGDHAGDLLDTYSEYSVQFRKLGLDGKEATGLLIQGLKAGARDVDTVADGIKEFSIRAIDGSKASAEGFKALGLNASQMTAQIAAGGEGAQKGLDTVLDRLRAMEDPVARDAAAVALFGTKAEDMGAALLALDTDTAADRLGNVTGAAGKLGDTLEQSSSQKLEAFKRQVQSALVEKLAEAIPTMEKVGKWASDNSDLLLTIGTVIGGIAIAIWAVNAAMAVWSAVTTVATAAQWLLNIAMMANPVGLIILAIVALVAGIWLLWENSSAFRDFWIMIWDAIWGAMVAVGRWFRDTLWPWMKDVWSKIADAAGAAKDWIVEKWDAFIGFFTKLPGRLRAQAKGMWDGIKEAFKSAVNWIIGRWNNLSFRIPGISVPGLGQVWGGATLSTPDLPYLAGGGTATRDGMAYVAERGREAVYLPAGAQVRPLGPGETASATTGPTEVRLTGELRVRGQDLVLVLRDRVAVGGGSVQAVIGTST